MICPPCCQFSRLCIDSCNSITFSEQIEYYELESIVLTSDFAGKLMKVMKDDPTSIPTLSSLVLSDPFVDEETQKTAELFHISLFLSNDLLNPSITLAPYSQMSSFISRTHNSAEQVDPNSNLSSPSTTHHRKLRLVRNEQRFVHKASVDDYDSVSPEMDSPQPVVYPLLTYDPGLLDTALIFVVLNRGKCTVGTFLVKLNNAQRVKRTHLQLITQCDLWNQRIFCPTMNKTKDLVFLADRSLSFVEEFLLEMIVIREEGCICYVSSPSFRNKVIQAIHPSVVICDDKESNQMADSIVSSIYDCKRSSQQQIWKQYSANVHFPIVCSYVERRCFGLQQFQLRSTHQTATSDSVQVWLRFDSHHYSLRKRNIQRMHSLPPSHSAVIGDSLLCFAGAWECSLFHSVVRYQYVWPLWRSAHGRLRPAPIGSRNESRCGGSTAASRPEFRERNQR